jgi:hypothetical protein
MWREKYFFIPLKPGNDATPSTISRPMSRSCVAAGIDHHSRPSHFELSEVRVGGDRKTLR